MARDHRRNPVVFAAALALLAAGVVAVGSAGSASLPATVDEALALGYQRLVVRVAVADAGDVAAIASWAEPWEVDLEAGFLIIDVDELGYLRLLDEGFEVSLDAKKTVRANTVFEPLPDQTEGIPGFPCYRTVEETLAAAPRWRTPIPLLAAVDRHRRLVGEDGPRGAFPAST